MAEATGEDRTDVLSFRCALRDLSGTADLLTGTVVPWVSSRPATRWWFVRFVDPTGPHVRVRVRVPWSERHPLRRDLARALGPGAVERRHTPETGKYGGPSGVERAERIAHASSVAAVALSDRSGSGVAAAHLIAVAERSGCPTQFLHSYAWYWSGRGRLGPLWEERIRPLRTSPEAENAAAAARRCRGEPALGAYLRVLDDVLAEAPPARRWLDLVQHAHLMDNRLGLLPADEALLARLLWLAQPDVSPDSPAAAVPLAG